MPKRYAVKITRTAESDLADIWNYIAKDSPERAAEYIHKLEKHADTLALFPRRAPLVPELLAVAVEYRHLIHRNYRIIFRIEGNTVLVIRIIHGARLLELESVEPE